MMELGQEEYTFMERQQTNKTFKEKFTYIIIMTLLLLVLRKIWRTPAEDVRDKKICMEKVNECIKIFV